MDLHIIRGSKIEPVSYRGGQDMYYMSKDEVLKLSREFGIEGKRIDESDYAFAHRVHIAVREAFEESIRKIDMINAENGAIDATL